MDVEKLVKGDKVHFIDKHSVARKGVVERNRTTANGKLFLTVTSDAGTEVIQNKKKLVALG